MKKLFAALTTALLAFSLVVAAAPTALATPSTNEGVCTGLNSGKIDTSGSPLSVTVTAPAGMRITGYCVKAGSIKQGNGPEYVTLSSPEAEITFGHSSGKAVSHYSYSWEPIPTPTPLATASLSFIDETCSAAQQLDLANFLTSNATFGSDTDPSALGYSVVATADGDAEFADGDGDVGNLTQKTFTGTLADTDTEKCQKAIPGDPLVTPQACVAGVLVSGSIWVDLQPGLTYTITNIDTKSVISPVTTATTALPPGNYTASVVANRGYVLSGDASWPYTVEITAPVNCELVTPPTPPRVDITCKASGSYTLPTAEGVIWRVNGDVVEPGTYKVFFGKTVTITAVPRAPAYGFVAEVTTRWVYTFTAPIACGQLITHPLVTPADVTVKSPTCTTSGSYTIPATEGVLWSIGTRSVLPGTYEVTSPQRITVVASPDSPDYGFEFGVKTEWPMTFTAVNSSLCGDLTTLALTGVNGAIINIGASLAAGLVLLGGAGIYARRRYLNSSN